MKIINKIYFLGALLLFCLSSFSQNNAELDRLIDLALVNNRSIKAGQYSVESSKANIRSAWDVDKTKVYYGYDSNNKADNNRALRVLGIEQEVLFPTVYNAQRNLNKSKWEEGRAQLELTKNQLALAVSTAYDEVVYLQNKELLYQELDSLYTAFAKAGNRRFELGETNYLEKITSEAKTKQISTTLKQITSMRKAAYERLYALVQSDENIIVEQNRLNLIHLDKATSTQYLQNEYFDKIGETFSRELKLQNQNWLPNLSVELFSGTSPGLGKRLNGFQVGVAIPLFFSGNVAKRKTAKFAQQSWEMERANHQLKMESYALQKQLELEQLTDAIRYYTSNGQKLSQEILKTANVSFKNGEIDFFQYIQSIENSTDIEVQFLESVLAYNKSYLELHYFNYNE